MRLIPLDSLKSQLSYGISFVGLCVWPNRIFNFQPNCKLKTAQSTKNLREEPGASPCRLSGVACCVLRSPKSSQSSAEIGDKTSAATVTADRRRKVKEDLEEVYSSSPAETVSFLGRLLHVDHLTKKQEAGEIG
ncbi:unnamed protein product [Gadus morhua 'NCC']